MALVGLVRSEWSGTSGGPGVSQMAVIGAAGGDWNPTGAQTAVNAVRSFWDSLKAFLPDEVKIVVSPVVDTFQRETGELFSSHVAGTAPAQVLGTVSTTGYAGGAGFKVVWNTGQIRNGRRVRGSTFVVPAANVYGNTGNILSTTQTSVNTACTSLISALNAGGTPLAVWSRPVGGDTPRVGFATEVVQGNCSSKTAILRGRRD